MSRRHRRPLALMLAACACACGGDRGASASRSGDAGVAATDSTSAVVPEVLARSPHANGQATLSDTSLGRALDRSTPVAAPSAGIVVRRESSSSSSRDTVIASLGSDSLADPIAPAAPATAATSPPPTAADAPPPASREAPPRRAFAVGERLSYEVRFGSIRVGSATMELRGVEEIRGEPAFHAVFRVQGGNALYRVDDHYESWFSTATLASLRYEQNIDQGSYERMRRFDIYPERRVFREAGKPADEPSVSEPLDDASFLYFLRSVPLEVGRTYSFDRYFRPDRNPVTVRVLRRERVRVPAGEFDAIVVRPTIKTKGIFSEGGQAEVWFADDSTRRILQIRSRLRFGSLNLYLR